MKIKLIQQKLDELDISINDINFGEFDFIGEYTAKKNRSSDSVFFKSAGCFFRPNYERGILIYYLIKKFNIETMLEIGFGRGYGTLCAAKAMTDFKIPGKITTVDPNFDREHINLLQKIFPSEWFEKINFAVGTSDNFFSQNSSNYDLIYIDGDHTEAAVSSDWNNSKNLYNKFLLFDDYFMPGKIEKDMECAKVIDKIDDDSKELIIMDRRLFFDDRRIKDEDIDYGQVLLTKEL